MKLKNILSQLKNTLVSNPFSNTYVIPKGEHYCSRSAWRPVLVHSLMSFTVRFDESCRYTLNKTDQHDVNKLWGFTESLFSDKNSARIGWNYKNGKLYLRPYTHYEGKHSIDPPGTEIEIGQDVQCSIVLMENYYLFIIGHSTHRLPRKGKGEWVLGWQKFPYFGGNLPSPHDIKIVIK